MKRDEVKELFQKFKQFSQDSANRKIGTGLGLFITKEIVEQSGGQIRVFSNYGVGTEFVVCLPTYTSPEMSEMNIKLNDALSRL